MMVVMVRAIGGNHAARSRDGAVHVLELDRRMVHMETVAHQMVELVEDAFTL